MRFKSAVAAVIIALQALAAVPLTARAEEKPASAEVKPAPAQEKTVVEEGGSPKKFLGFDQADTTPEPTIKTEESWGLYKGGREGFAVVKQPYATLNISGYLLMRYINQLPASQSFTDHNGVSHEIHMRNDFSMPHRVLLNVYGMLYDPKFNYTVTLWTVQATNSIAIIGHLDYLFNPHFNLYAGVGSMPGTRSMNYSHPYWLGTDRVMADEFFRPGFTQGVWASGEIFRRLFYQVMIGNNITTVNVSAGENKRDLAAGGSLWWMPTTGEFGPKGGYGDFEEHNKMATRFGTSYTHSREDQLTTDPNNPMPDETQIHMADSLLLFQLGSLGPGIQVHKANYDMSAVDAAMKYKGFFLMGEFYSRWLSRFDTTGGPAPVKTILDRGFHVQAAQMIVPQKWELYSAASLVFGDKHAGYSDSSDYLLGANRFLFGSRNCRLNAQVNYVTRSAASSNFGYYVGGQTGTILSASWALAF